MYVFDTSPFSTLFRNFYRPRFPSLWQRFDELIADGSIVSTREALFEIQDSADDGLRDWATDNKGLFAIPNAAEGAFISEVFQVAHFRQIIELKKLLKGGRNADPFLIAKAAVEGRAVVTMESRKPNAAKIPNICEHFDVPCMSLEEFMEAENWQF